jgi:hypothetical protein
MRPPDHRLRERLTEMRDDALGLMLRRGTVEPGHLPLIAGINTTLDAIDQMPVEAETRCRAVVSDDGCEIRLKFIALPDEVYDRIDRHRKLAYPLVG